MKVAIIGTTGYAQVYLDHLARLSPRYGVEVVAVVAKGLIPEMPLLLRAKRYSEAGTMLEEWNGKLDLCCIPTGIDSHAGLCMSALAAGSHVLLEKPAAATLGQIEDVARSAAKYGRKVFVGYQHLYTDVVWQIKRMLAQGALGHIHRAKLLGLWPRSEAYFRRNHWAGRVQVEGHWVLDSPLHNAFAHYVNLLAFWTSESESEAQRFERVEGRLWRANDIDTFDSCAINVETCNGIGLEIYLSHACADVLDPVIRIEGNLGTLDWCEAGFTLRGEDVRVAANNSLSLSLAREAMFDRVLAELTQGGQYAWCGLELAKPPTQLAGLVYKCLTVQQARPVDIQKDVHGVQRVHRGNEALLRLSFGSTWQDSF
ncbi:MAG: Gfo/Idh/MocA family oxidoreductase [Bacteroidetes bacterium]|jgi:predicted dehydrogenase|nr:Gfo/Idh/MocA family oxidoreductase [Bacteroidota bacterium]